MHVGQTVLYALAIGMMVRSRWRHLAWLWPAAMLTTVMATANHYWLDGVIGAVVVAVAFGLTKLVVRRPAMER
jgi:MFS superfamily sulfate permease-like transporter